MSALRGLLDGFRNEARNKRDMGTGFENLIQDFLGHDPLYRERFDGVWTYTDWARDHQLSGQDAGIDLVARQREDGGYCAIQCKLYPEDTVLNKSHLDSFFAASGKAHFSSRLFVDSTSTPWSRHADALLDGQAIPCKLLNLEDLEASAVDWARYASDGPVLQTPKTSMPHQVEAIGKTVTGLRDADRGKLIMACGTGKTWTSLQIAEQIAGAGKRVLYLVPSLALMSQTIRAWHNDSKLALHSFAVCSDSQVSRQQQSDDDISVRNVDLALPATTDAAKLAVGARGLPGTKMQVIFATYHSLPQIALAQADHGLQDFDLIICDEAHRTTGVTLADEGESAFVLVHNQDRIRGHKRLYMTATERIYSGDVKTRAKGAAAELCSMDDPAMFGETFHSIGFAEAVERDLLCDYKVIVLAMDQDLVSRGVQQRLSDSNLLKLDDATKIIGCYRALSKQGLQDQLGLDVRPMQRALAFCNSIETSRDIVKPEFSAVITEFLEKTGQDPADNFRCEVDHVDGSFGARDRQKLLTWLESNDDPDCCRILSNARCMSEGVDVPSLDAVLFLNPRKSIVDIVQAVGRVMRKSDATGKKLGYIILPVGIPAGIDASTALENSKDYKVIWQVLNALRAHDERMDATINSGEDGNRRIEIFAEIHDVRLSADNPADTGNQLGDGSNGGGGDRAMALEAGDGGNSKTIDLPLIQGRFLFDEFREAVMAQIVKNCGTRDYWQDWASDIGHIAKAHISRINAAINNKDSAEETAFDAFLDELRDDLNDSISREEAVEMLAQHIITRPVFDALFKDSGFTKHNPVSRALEQVLSQLEGQKLDKENDQLEGFYASIRRRVDGVITSTGKQKIILELYDSFFRNAFPRLTQKLGIVYTPVEVVDFIIHSVNDILKQEFGQTLGSKGVHILDPFTGTGTFITRMLQSGLIKPEELAHKYKTEIHANEIVLLAYYIAAINIEQAYHDISGSNGYEPFEGICLTDTFQPDHKSNLVDRAMIENSTRRTRQNELDIRVIMGNPPYSAGQKNANDDNANVSYPVLDEAIRATYAKHSTANNLNGLYDSYIRAFRWASERIATTNKGIIGFVSGNAWIERQFADGMRHCLEQEFTSIHVINLRGDIRKNMLSKGLAKEGENIFGQNSMTGICITFLVKNPDDPENGKIYYHDIGDDLSKTSKLENLKKAGLVSSLFKTGKFIPIEPDEKKDWLNQRDTSFNVHVSLGSRSKTGASSLFTTYSRGLETGRDAWCYNFSKTILLQSISQTISSFNLQSAEFASQNRMITPNHFVDKDPTKISWTASLLQALKKGQQINFNPSLVRCSLNKPFLSQHLYLDKMLVHRPGQHHQFFPSNHAPNSIIIVSGPGARSGFSALLTNTIPNLHTLDTCQCFPLYLYEKNDGNDLLPSGDTTDGYTRRDAITDEGLRHFTSFYPGADISKEDIFYYVYGLLHSDDYRQRFKNNLSKELPRIPRVKTATDFWAFVKAGRLLGDLHVNYEQVDPWPVNYADGGLLHDSFTAEDYRVSKMKFGKKGKDKDRSTVIYNNKITMTDIPLDAYNYVVNGKAALDWVMDRQCVKTDKASGIVNDANDYAIETMKDPAYPLKLFQRVITVSMSSLAIIRSLPVPDIEGT